MKKIAFSGEKEEKDDIALTDNNLRVISLFGRSVILPSILEENRTGEVGAIPAPAVVYKPTPLRYFRRPTVDFNGIDIPTGDDQHNLKFDQLIDSTLRRLSNYVPRNSDVIKKRMSNNLTPDLGRLRHDFFDAVEDDDVAVDTTLSLRLPGTTDPKKSRLQSNLGLLRLRPDFFDGVEDDEVDTTLSLRLPGTTDPKKKSRMQEKGKGRSLGHNPTSDMISNLGCLRPDFFNGVEDDEVDTTLSLRLPGTVDPKKSRMQEKGKGKALDHNPTGDMSNLGWRRPGFFDGAEDDEVDTTLSLRLPGTANPKKSTTQAKGKKRRADAGDMTQENKTSKRRNIGEYDNSRPLIPIEEIPTLMKAVESRNGSSPKFLYRKILEMSDVVKGQNRLLVTRRGRMMDFLRPEEKAAVDNVGLKIVGVDGGGNVYDKLVLKQWRSMSATVINSDWRKVVEANKAEIGDVVEIWGFKVDEKPCLAFNFRKQNAASTSGTSCIDEGTSMVFRQRGLVN